jgi:hypothetical protein
VADKQPVAVRIVRPYESEEEFLRHDIHTLTRTTVVLVGAQQRPDGVVLRFEVSLKNGQPLLRGEGRVVGYRANALGNEPGLMLRFTRLDSRSKALVDRAAALRDARSAPQSNVAPPPAPAAAPPPPPAPPEAAPPPPAAAPEAAPPPPPAAPEAAPPPAAAQVDVSSGSSPSPERAAPSSDPAPQKTETLEIPIVVDLPKEERRPPATAIGAVREREATLARLRERAKSLSRETILAILEKSGSHRTTRM